MTEPNTNYDSPCQEIIEDYFPQFLEFFFHDAYVEIDWECPYEFLDSLIRN